MDLDGICSGSLEAFSFDAYVVAMCSGVHDGLANGYPVYTTNINPTIGVFPKF